MKKAFLFLFGQLIITSCGFAQGEYLRKDQSGFGISPGFTNVQSKTATGGSAGVSIGYSYRAIVDLNFGYVKANSSENNALTSNISYYLSNQSNKDDETTAISLLLQNGGGNTNFGFAFSLAHNFFFEVPIVLQPSFNVSIYPSYKQTLETKTEIVLSTGLSMGWRTESGHSFSFVPTVSYQDNYFYLGVSLSIVLLTDKFNN